MATKKTKKKARPVPKRVPITAREKRTIRSMTAKGASMREIAARIGRVPSTIWRWQHRED